MKNIALIGFMGTGKTAVGQRLAKKLEWSFIETDLLIEQKAGKTIPEIFQQDGEISFRETEIGVIKDIIERKDVVIACGGGAVLNKINIDRLREHGIIIYLTASPETVLKRVSSGGNQRPLLDVDNPAQTIRELMEFREPFYQRAADITVDTSKLDINAVAEQIINRLKENESFDF
ncbi:MAG: shikimate kinase [Dehalococcoidales bacterium]|nr:MAG: shikimate kinase [Dehalococcoidales bacterium]